jgi:hypothetical protein
MYLADTDTEYELYYKNARGETHDQGGRPLALEGPKDDKLNQLYCMSNVTFMNPNGAPEDEIAMVFEEGTGVMMEWERPISMSFLYIVARLFV